ncbi:hypothetical protein [Algoriphagus sp. NG3]|uniref:hypothetical protein n=1 Tax=unclassified Algoriphagus TaxID=2641541 RepID=UPI002A816797|nr:hypothetical protein [Algoriphagus sp. NG3]WPR76737.1 hypothetical protein SLW71_05210 [Algoriphagus sp. NG3]
MISKSDIVELHSIFFKKYGFELNPCNSSFEKAFEGGKQVVAVYCFEGKEGIIVDYSFGIRIHAIEELVNQHLPTLINNVEESLTMDMPMGKLGNYRPGVIKISTALELDELVDNIEKFFSLKGFSWLDQMSDPHILEQQYYCKKRKPNNPNEMVEIAFRSIALSKLFNPENYPELRQAYLEKMDYREMTPLTIASFFHFLNYLDHLNPIAA